MSENNLNIRQTKAYVFMDDDHIYLDAFQELVEKVQQDVGGIHNLDHYINFCWRLEDKLPAKKSIRRGDKYPAVHYKDIQELLEKLKVFVNDLSNKLEEINNQNCCF